MFELLESNQVSLSTMKTSKFFLAFEKQVDHWERTLSHIVEVIDIFLTVQRQWYENLAANIQDVSREYLCGD